MAADASSYSVLGLDPDADWSSVERAYKTLIKTHHPDRAGGDPARAADINRAYRELRHARSAPDSAEEPWLEPEDAPSERTSKRWLAAALGIAGGAALLVLVATPIGGLIDDFRMRAAAVGVLAQPQSTARAPADPMTEPLYAAAIAQSVASATRVSRIGDEGAMAQASRACHARLHLQPSLPQLDECAAFDDAIVELQGRDPLRDSGPFGQVAITGRAMSGAALFSDDYVAIDARLGRIRREVEQALAPALPQIDAVNAAD
jgi:hypothetical protein